MPYLRLYCIIEIGRGILVLNSYQRGTLTYISIKQFILVTVYSRLLQYLCNYPQYAINWILIVGNKLIFSYNQEYEILYWYTKFCITQQKLSNDFFLFLLIYTAGFVRFVSTHNLVISTVSRIILLIICIATTIFWLIPQENYQFPSILFIYAGLAQFINILTMIFTQFELLTDNNY